MFWRDLIYFYMGADPGFPVGLGADHLGGGTNTIFRKKFHKNPIN